jgi:hypothetical protein
MKNFTFILAFMLLATLTSKATIWTVSNDANQPAQYSSLQMACDSASAGDTIYVQGTATNYGTIHIKKRLHLIGAGIKPSGNYLYGYPSSVSTIYLDTVSFISGASGCTIEGLEIQHLRLNYSGLKNLIIRRNRITTEIRNYSSYYNYSSNAFSVSNILIVNNISASVLLLNTTNVIVMNNIFTAGVNSSNSSTIISNNIFLHIGAFSSCQSSTISNNIFYYGSIGSANYCSFSNNLAFGLSTSIVTGTNSGTNNITADPKFTYLYSTTIHSYNDQNKYTLKSSSPAKNAGTDGTDIGITGGQYPWPASVLVDYIHCIPPSIPQVEQLVIQNTSVPANGTLNFSVKDYKTAK